MYLMFCAYQVFIPKIKVNNFVFNGNLTFLTSVIKLDNLDFTDRI